MRGSVLGVVDLCRIPSQDNDLFGGSILGVIADRTPVGLRNDDICLDLGPFDLVFVGQMDLCHAARDPVLALTNIDVRIVSKKPVITSISQFL